MKRKKNGAIVLKTKEKQSKSSKDLRKAEAKKIIIILLQARMNFDLRTHLYLHIVKKLYKFT